MTYPDPTELTKAQQNAVNQLKSAFTAAKKARIYFYQNLDNVFALNGNVVESVFTMDESHRADCSLREFSSPVRICDNLLNPFADDEHFVLFKEAAKHQGGTK